MCAAHLIYFSPTGTTRKIISSIAAGFGANCCNYIDFTLCSESKKEHFSDGIAIIGVPVYAGRVPEVCLERMANYRADNVPTIVVALYGNREYEDALVELRDVVTAHGFNVIAAAAFIGEHSYSTLNSPIAAGRPNSDDLALASGFGKQVAEKIKRNDFSAPEIAGKIPYKERVKFGGVAPETDAELCVCCGKCATVCPMDIITVSDRVTTQADNCIMCCACIKICELEARQFKHPLIAERRQLLITHCSTPKSPEIFL